MLALSVKILEVVSKLAGGTLGKAIELLFLRKQDTDKDKSLQTPLLKISSAENDCEIAGERIYIDNGGKHPLW